MGLVTVFCPLTTIGGEELVLQTAEEPRLVVDCKVNPMVLVGHVKITYGPEGTMVSCGRVTGLGERLNTVPPPQTPPSAAVPYKAPPDKINPACGQAPSLLVPESGEIAVKLWRFVKPVPSVLTANTVPVPFVPPH